MDSRHAARAIAGPGAVAAVGLCAALSVALAASPQQLIFRAGIHGVEVDVSVKNGAAPVRGLTSGDFLLTDNGVEQTVEAVSIDSVPIDVTLLVDTSASTLSVIEQFKAEVQRCADLLRPTDRVRLVTASDRVDEVFPMQPPRGHLPVAGMTAGGGTAINDGVIYAFAWDPGVDRRHLIVAFTDGEDNESVSQPATVVAVASRLDAVTHVVLSETATPATPGPSIGLRRAEIASRSAIQDAALQSGGAVHHVADAVAAFAEALEDFRQSYLLYYSPLGVPHPGWHDIHVAVRAAAGARWTVRARKGYAGG